jgi:hypothetical protein
MPGMLEVADRERDELWELSVARDRELKRREMDALRYRWHAGQAERLRETMTEETAPITVQRPSGATVGRKPATRRSAQLCA